MWLLLFIFLFSFFQRNFNIFFNFFFEEFLFNFVVLFLDLKSKIFLKLQFNLLGILFLCLKNYLIKDFINNFLLFYNNLDKFLIIISLVRHLLLLLPFLELQFFIGSILLIIISFLFLRSIFFKLNPVKFV